MYGFFLYIFIDNFNNILLPIFVLYINDMARPTKLTDNFLKIAKEIINQDDNAIIFTDAELLEEINWKLDEPEQISKATFENWKQGTNNEFLDLIKRARHKQKKNLLQELKTTPNNWQRFAWILERKFTEFNLKKISETTHKIEPITINFKF